MILQVAKDASGIVDSGKEQIPISREDFEYLQVVGDLIGEAVGKAELVGQLISSYERRDEMVKDVTHYCGTG